MKASDGRGARVSPDFFLFSFNSRYTATHSKTHCLAHRGLFRLSLLLPLPPLLSLSLALAIFYDLYISPFRENFTSALPLTTRSTRVSLSNKILITSYDYKNLLSPRARARARSRVCDVVR